MCGIFAYIGSKDAVKISIAGLKKLEYRGYDSSGIAGIENDEIVLHKEIGKISAMEKNVSDAGTRLDLAIAHTRWATHGKPSKDNAHPHLDQNNTLALVHNGIIENHDSLRKQLKEEGFSFRSQTDSEVIAQLISKNYQGDLKKAVRDSMEVLKGSFAIAVIHKDHPKQIVAVANQSPLAIGIGNGESFIASDTQAFIVHTREVIFLSDSEIAIIEADKLSVYNKKAEQVLKKAEPIDHDMQEASKGDFEHFMLKEIFEQPQTIRNALWARFMQEYGMPHLEGLNFDVNDLISIRRILILACGTSLHAGHIAAYMIEDKARIPVQVEISSEFRYKNPIVEEDTLVIAISQSGETADTLAATKELKAKGAHILAVCNVQGSSLTREANACLFLRAGAEIGVASTKAFTSQLVVLSLFALLLGRTRHLSKKEGQTFLDAIAKLPQQVDAILSNKANIETLAKKYADFNNFFYLGRHYMYPASLEGALKLKEISYINANGYPAGEMKHGPIALIHPDCPTVAFCANKMTLEKMLSNLMEVKARNGLVLAIAEKETPGIEEIADDVLWVPETLDELAPILSCIVSQLLAYYIAKERGAEIDQPRNLAKSVTVE